MKYLLLLFASAAYAQSSITINNAGSCTSTGTPTSLVVNCAPTTPPVLPSGSITSICRDFGYAVVDGGTLPFTTPKGGNAAFGDTQAWVFTLPIPTGTLNSTSNGSMTVADNGGNEHYKYGIVSLTPCDFDGKSTPILDGCANAATCSLNLAIRATGNAGNGVAPLRPGQTYYISYRLWVNGGGSCGAGATCSQIYNYQNTK